MLQNDSEKGDVKNVCLAGIKSKNLDQIQSRFFDFFASWTLHVIYKLFESSSFPVVTLGALPPQ